MLRNRYAQHAVPPYAVRPRPKAPVAAPLHWEELDDREAEAGPLDDRVDARRGVESDGDAWHGISGRARSVSAALRRLGA